MLEAANSGSLIGHPVENICIVLNDGAAHTVDSSELVFKLAAIYAFRQTFLLEGPRPRWRFQRVIQEKYSYLIDEKRVFYSDIKNDNPLSCIFSKVTITQLTPEMDHDAKEAAKKSCELYVDMMYSFSHAFTKFYTDNEDGSSMSDGLIRTKFSDVAKHRQDIGRTNGTLLDLYSGCGAMSSGLCIGASLDGVTITTKWAVDYNLCACESLRSNHPNTEYVVEKILDICYGDPNKKEFGLYFKVRWEGYKEKDDTWPREKMKEFVSQVHKAKAIPLPGDVDFICGGPPCQGISSFNRFRNKSDPLKDEKNRQMVLYMDIVEFLKPRFILMENVTDILKFADGQLARYAVGRLVSTDYQARLGIMVAGAYGVPQCRMRFYLWGAAPTERLPQFPLPTHKTLKKGVFINEFKECIVGHENENA
ncbi:Alpha-1,3-mannosyltransferase cmt1 [Castilleja foliolosa]|uniref:DNA (cytosine-5-)-methyltransferase n=1 Tax=Castilleja foliolosa TaxID=1961234 RepID=A0ABD3BKT1_9LAMI